ncbi:PEP-CTERM sorting domain-containing protein [Rubritalea tangerina]|uniref:PEP-CTERM sorting domain-containing protein n=1 Tax=Rubritalea tangerina TaxID=430798 RepID=A0ABW4Z997_9BACT
MKHTPLTSIACALTLTLGSASLTAATISINFVGNTNLNNVGADSPTSIVGLNGVQAQDWVNLAGTSATDADIDGASGSATISFSTNWRFNTGGTSGTENHNMMDGAIRLGGTGDSAPVISNLGTDFTSSGYDVYVYFGSDSHNRVHRFTLTPTGDSTSNNSGTENLTQAYNGAFTETNADGDVGNYLVFRGITASEFTLSDNGTSPGKPGVAGIEIVAVPEPSLSLLLGLGGFSLTLRRRR